jgi:hypothetical protein
VGEWANLLDWAADMLVAMPRIIARFWLADLAIPVAVILLMRWERSRRR